MVRAKVGRTTSLQSRTAGNHRGIAPTIKGRESTVTAGNHRGIAPTIKGRESTVTAGNHRGIATALEALYSNCLLISIQFPALPPFLSL